MSREIYSIRWDRRSRLWICPQLGSYLSHKLPFVAMLARKLRRRWKFAHVLCQLRIYGKNGRIQSERTYGKDPRRFKG